MPMATKLGGGGIELPSIRLQSPLITWSCKVTSKIRSVISLLPQVLWPPNLAKYDIL